MYTLKSIARRATMLGAAFVVAASAFTPFAPSAFADALNPLTDRSLTLSSGSPGWAFTDGSGNSTYAPPNSGANGQKTGNTFGFKVSSTATVKGFSFQYCTASAGDCMGPGDNICATGTTGGGDCVRETNAAAHPNKRSDLEVKILNPTAANFATYVTNTNAGSNPDGLVSSVPDPSTAGTNFLVYYNNAGTWTVAPGTWTMDVDQKQTYNGAAGIEGDGKSTNKDNYITLASSTGVSLNAGQEVRVVFFGKDDNYITNPGSKEFFVKINTWNTENTANWTPGDMTYNIDGGVTVANVMNQSIQITTKVLETMDFSVGVVDPYTLEATQASPTTSQLYAATGSPTHGVCERILNRMTTAGTEAPNSLKMGDENAEFSLKTSATYSTHSYWRLSSNSSAGATVYYSGVTLSNTVGDKIDPIYGTTLGDGLKHTPTEGMEQFGLALANGTRANNLPLWDPSDNSNPTHLFSVNYNTERGGAGGANPVYEWGADNAATGLGQYGNAASIDPSVTDDAVSNLDANPSWHMPRLYPLEAGAQYDGGAGNVNSEYGTVDAQFAFDETSNTIPVPIATENNQVVDCVTGKMRYIANIAATTPAGIYTTKINYIAAPQY